MMGRTKGAAAAAARCVSLRRERIAMVDEGGKKSLAKLARQGRRYTVAETDQLRHAETFASLQHEVSHQEQEPLRDQPGLE